MPIGGGNRKLVPDLVHYQIFFSFEKTSVTMRAPFALSQCKVRS